MLSLYVSRIKRQLELLTLCRYSHYIIYSSKTETNIFIADFNHIHNHIHIRIFPWPLHLHIFPSTLFFQCHFVCQHHLYCETCFVCTANINIACRPVSTLLLNPLTFIYFYQNNVSYFSHFSYIWVQKQTKCFLSSLVIAFRHCLCM